jgi:hypothetical protein
MKFTPGQWKAIITGDQPQKLYKGLICLIEHSPDNYISVVQANGRVVESDEWEANARLIAAAPELLEAAEEAYRFMKFAVNMWPDAEICQESGATIEKLKRAIAGAYE